MSLKAFCNVQGTPTPARAATAAVVTDIQIPLEVEGVPTPDPPGAWAASRAAFTNPVVLVGTYASSRMALPVASQIVYPGEAVDLADYNAGQYWPYGPDDRPEGEYLDYTQPATLTQLSGDLTQFAADRGEDILYLDNVVHPDAGGVTVPTWAQTMALAAAVKAAIDPVKVYLNIAWSIGAVPVVAGDLTLLIAGCHGITLEIGLLAAVGEDSAKLADAVAAYQTLIDAGVDVIFIPPDGNEAEAQFMAGMAMVLWGPRVVLAWFRDDPAWVGWDTTYGAPTGAIVQDGTTLTREFGDYTFTVDCAARTVTIGASSMAAIQFIKGTYDKLWDLLEAHPGFIDGVRSGNRIDWTTGQAVSKKYGKHQKQPADYPEFELGLSSFRDSGFMLTRNYGMRNPALNVSTLVWTGEYTQAYTLTIRTDDRKLTMLQLLLLEALTAIRKGGPRLTLSYVMDWGEPQGSFDLFALDQKDPTRISPTVSFEIPVHFVFNGSDLIT